MKNHFNTTLPKRRPCGMAQFSQALLSSVPPFFGLCRALGVILVMVVFANLSAKAETLSVPLNFVQNSVLYNLQSQRGVPISSEVNTNIGSDGRMPATNSSTGLSTASSPATSNQFKGFISFGAVTAPPGSNWLSVSNSPFLRGSNAFSYQVASAMQLPTGRTNDNDASICMVLRRAQVGAPYLSRQVSCKFGSIVSAPATDINGVLLPTNSVPEDYWQVKPWSDGSDTNQYYWSPNAQAVFATQPGPISITWISATPYPAGSPPYTNLLGKANFYTNGANLYPLYTVNYVVSGTAFKLPQRMYWTEGSFQSLGYPISVPSARVTAVHVVYNNVFRDKVTTPYADPNTVPITDPTNMLREFRTLWFDSTMKQIRAYNTEGRVFVELLGGPIAGGSANEYLGFEIVDVYRAPTPSEVTNYLGERLTAYSDGRDDSNLDPWPIQNTLGQQFYYPNTGKPLYADRATQNRNDLQVHWLITGVAGLEWPSVFARYALVWPGDAAKYSHYLRPLVDTKAQAALTSVQLDGSEAPTIDYQDPLDQTRGWLTSTYAYYTFLNPNYPAHRALLRFTSGDQIRFERVFSWLDLGIKNNSLLNGSVATNLDAWNPSQSTLAFADSFVAPYITNATVNVGDRINAPASELGATGAYWAGYILQVNGNSFNPGAYHDPFEFGFNIANKGAIIPVNAIPGHNQLEVWWFRQNDADPAQGFQPVYWPTVIGHYSIQWPDGAAEIIMAGNAGSGDLESIKSRVSIYSQNQMNQPGYNPNEEHALMVGGQVYALRDDLNITTTNGYSSDPFALLNYSESDGRPAMQAFKVRREKPEAGILFDYVVAAGNRLHGPMPLQFMEPPVEGVGASAINYNTEPPANSLDLPVGWRDSDVNGPYALYRGFTFKDRNNDYWVYRGPHAGLPPLQAGQYNVTNNTFGPLLAATAVANQPFEYFVHVSRLVDSLTMSDDGHLPNGLSTQTSSNGLVITGTPAALGSNSVSIVITDLGDGSIVTNILSINVVSNGSVVAQGPLVITSTNQYSRAMVSYTNRPPTLAQAPTPSNSFTMRYYYKTRSDFDWPGIDNPPAPGTIVPYLRPVDGNGGFVGDATSKNTASLGIVYRPVWPEIQNQKELPTLNLGNTLTTAKDGLAAVRGQSSVQVLYQQSIGANMTAAPASVVLYDPTVQKTSSLAAMNGLPSTVVAAPYQGKMYFQKLPPQPGQPAVLRSQYNQSGICWRVP